MQWTIKAKLIMIGLAAINALAIQTWLVLDTTERAGSALAEMSLGVAAEQGGPRELLAGLVGSAQHLATLPGDSPDAAAQSSEMEASLLLLRELLDDAAASTRKRDRKEAVLMAGKLLLDLERSIVLDLPRARTKQAGPEGLAHILGQITAQAAELETALAKIRPGFMLGKSAVTDEIMAELQNGADVSLTLLMVSLFVLIILILFLGLSITQPMVQITEAMNRLAKGEPDVLIDLTRMDEVGQMALALQALKERMAELEAHRR